jgi:hypothetical protein
MRDLNKLKQTLDKIDSYIYALVEIIDGKRIPFYIGKGKGNRCLQHLKNNEASEKRAKIDELIKLDTLGIDILRHGIKDNDILSLIESTCIDLMGIGELTNKIRGKGTNLGRMSIEEIDNLLSQQPVTIASEHSGLAFLLNTTYKSGMSQINLFESTRGVWKNPPIKDDTIKFAYATSNGIIKEIYEIHSWVKAGTQQYFTRSFDRDISDRWEFIGRITNDSTIRENYIGKLIHKDRSYGSPFVKVGG